jgi:hypothetical protein
MSQVLPPRTETTGDGPSSPGRTPGRGRRSLVLLVVLLGLFFGAAAGWAVYTAAAGGSGQIRGAEAWTARLEAEAEHYARIEGARHREADQRRWEAQADRYAPGWRDQ